MEHSTEVFTGIDVAKALAIADGGRGGDVRFFGEVDASLDAMRRILQRITAKYGVVHFCYEAGPTGYGLYRLIVELGHSCMVVAPSLIPKRAGDRVKTDRRDAMMLARLLRACELTVVGCPMRGMTRCMILYGLALRLWRPSVFTGNRSTRSC